MLTHPLNASGESEISDGKWLYIYQWVRLFFLQRH
jgi:hypothetical protein